MLHPSFLRFSLILNIFEDHIGSCIDISYRSFHPYFYTFNALRIIPSTDSSPSDNFWPVALTILTFFFMSSIEYLPRKWSHLFGKNNNKAASYPRTLQHTISRYLSPSFLLILTQIMIIMTNTLFGVFEYCGWSVWRNFSQFDRSWWLTQETDSKSKPPHYIFVFNESGRCWWAIGIKIQP